MLIAGFSPNSSSSFTERLFNRLSPRSIADISCAAQCLSISKTSFSNLFSRYQLFWVAYTVFILCVREWDKGPWRQQAILGRRRWEADRLKETVREYVIEHFGEEEGILVIDETGFLKKGKATCGVAPQYTGTVGKITNCQIGVFAAYVSSKGYAFIDRKLYLPKEWIEDQTRRAAAHIPVEQKFSTKPTIARKMIEETIEAKIPFSWVAADSVYGISEVTETLRKTCKGYVLGTTSRRQYYLWDNKKESVRVTTAEELASKLGSSGIIMDKWPEKD